MESLPWPGWGGVALPVTREKPRGCRSASPPLLRLGRAQELSDRSFLPNREN